jgi:hypothetical protein
MIGPVVLDKEPSRGHLAQRLRDRCEVPLASEPLEHVERPLVDRKHKRLAVISTCGPLVQDLRIGAGVGVGDHPGPERLQLWS